MTASHSSSVMFESMRSRRMPALLISTWRSPNVSIAAVTSRSAPAKSLDVVAVGDRLAAHRLDLVDDLLGGREIVARAVDRAADVVDHDLRAVAGEAEGVLAADTATGAGDDRDASFAEAGHLGCSL